MLKFPARESFCHVDRFCPYKARNDQKKQHRTIPIVLEFRSLFLIRLGQAPGQCRRAKKANGQRNGERAKNDGKRWRREEPVSIFSNTAIRPLPPTW